MSVFQLYWRRKTPGGTFFDLVVVVVFVVDVAPTQYMAYIDFPASLVEEDIRCPSEHYFRYERAPE
jgi:hypothetical protein